MKKIHVLCTGGTFDKVYGVGAGVRNFSFAEIPAAGQIIDRFHVPKVIVGYNQSLAKDSLDMTEEDRQRIADWCEGRRSYGYPCVVVHGTDTMIETARLIAEQCRGQVIVFTGASQPACVKDSDAEFNFGGALVAAQTCPPGVYIVMNGRVFDWDKCEKDPKTGQFVPK